MKKKIVGILVCTLLISTAAFSVAIKVNNTGNTSRGWSESQKLLASDGSLNDRFGCSAEINGYDAIIGAYFDDVSAQANAGSAYVFTYGGASWTQQAKLTASDAQSNDEFGWSVSIDGDYAIVGAHKEDGSGTDRGAAYIFYRSGSSWSQQQKLTPGDAEDGDYFGKSVSIDGEYAIVGAPGKSSNQGFSYIFKRTGGVWTQMTKVGATGSNKLGWSVSIDGAFVIMGAYGTNSNTGAAHIYELVGTSWYGRGALTASDGTISDLFGISVAIDGDYAICGAPGHDLGSGSEGATYLFEKPTTGWTDMTETQKITASDAAGGDGFGRSVSVDGDYAIVTAPDEDGSGTARGAAYIFKRGSSTWSEVAKVIASDGANQDYFGWSASVSGNFAIVGAYAEDNSNGVDAGSVYVFEMLEPDLDCDGDLAWTGVKPGETVTGSFRVRNIGDLGSELSWDIAEKPTWSTFTFNPPSGTGLTPAMSWITVNVSVVAPNQQNKNFSGTVKVVNLDDFSDNCTIDVSLATPVSHQINNHPLLQKILELFPNAFLILRNLLGI